MTNEPEKGQVQIVNRQMGEVHLSEPAVVQSPNAQEANTPPPTTTANPASAGKSAPVTASQTAPVAKAAVSKPPTPKEKPAKAAKAAKPKLEIETFEQFIDYAYKRRGQPVKLETKVQEAIVKQLGLDEAATERLLPLLNGDTLLAVPRQILLASREVAGLPLLRGALEKVVSMVMLRHPAFAPEGVKSAIHNLPGALPPTEALATVAGYKPTDVEGIEPLKPSDLKELRRNATHLLATWFALHRGVGLDDMSSLLFHALWEPAARELEDDTARLRALTDIADQAGAGVVAQRYHQQLADARWERDQAQRETAALTQQVVDLQVQRDLAQAQLEERTTELEALRVSSAQELAALRDAHNTGRMQQGHEFESLRGRLVQRLEECIEMLDTGLSALRKEAPTPRVSVMVQRAEVVLDALRSELISLREG